MSRKHWVLLIVGCALPVILLAAVWVLQLQISSALLFGFVLLCPLAHLLMLRDHGHHRPGEHDG